MSLHICRFAHLLYPAVFASLVSTMHAESNAVRLFDGKSLAGWTDVDGHAAPDNWSVQDGQLVRTGGGGSLYTRHEYGDFDLRFEWKIRRRGNSGVKYRVAFYEKGVHGNPGWLGPEYQMYDDPNAESVSQYSTAALYDLYPPAAEASARPPGEFNQSRIVTRGPKIQHWLNGVLVVDAEIGSDDWNKRVAASKFGPVKNFAKNPKGRIQLQDHSSKVWFRNIVITPLDAN
jgi:hypothetical protein